MNICAGNNQDNPATDLSEQFQPNFCIIGIIKQTHQKAQGGSCNKTEKGNIIKTVILPENKRECCY